ncbi:hypothetical protein AAIR98_001164 [Elusimicrobium simillimum]|uniref:hypothetical protein n=1 Tax=Elusimicrobium simillimum TaxID=3143438 RepID=UPI003C6EF8D6
MTSNITPFQVFKNSVKDNILMLLCISVALYLLSFFISTGIIYAFNSFNIALHASVWATALPKLINGVILGYLFLMAVTLVYDGKLVHFKEGALKYIWVLGLFVLVYIVDVGVRLILQYVKGDSYLPAVFFAMAVSAGLGFILKTLVTFIFFLFYKNNSLKVNSYNIILFIAFFILSAALALPGVVMGLVPTYLGYSGVPIHQFINYYIAAMHVMSFVVIFLTTLLYIFVLAFIKNGGENGIN